MHGLPIIIDCDPGHDDVIAIILALASDALDLKGITVVAGNQTLPKTLNNTLKVLEFINKDVPVAKGAYKPLLRMHQPAAECHGESGLDGFSLPAASKKEVELPAAQFIAKIVEESDEKITLVPIGPLTNIATFILAYPDLLHKIEQISLMGGYSIGGNRTAAAEFNIWQDPEAASIVFNSKIPIVMHGLDVTHKALVCPDDVERFRNSGNRVAVFVAELLDFYYKFYKNRGFTGSPVHDACAIAWLIDKSIFTSSKHFVQIDTFGEYTDGATVVDCRGFADSIPNAEVVFNVDREKLIDMLFDACQKYN